MAVPVPLAFPIRPHAVRRRPRALPPKYPYLSIACIAACAVAPTFPSAREVAFRSVMAAFILLAALRLRQAATVPLPMQLIGLAFVVACLPAAWARDTEAVLVPLYYAAFFYAVGGCGFEFAGRESRARRWVLIAGAAALSHAIGIIWRHGLTIHSSDRTGWNNVGLLAATAAIASTIEIPKVAAMAVFLPAVYLAIMSGSRNAVSSVAIGIAAPLIGSGGKLRSAVALAVIISVGVAVYSTAVLTPEVRSQYFVAERMARATSLQATHREEAWSYWFEICRENPLGIGFNVHQKFEVGGHNGWLDIWARGGIPCLLLFLAGQVSLLRRVSRFSRSDRIGAIALGLSLAGTVQMIFESFPLGGAYGMGTFPYFFIPGIALANTPFPSRPSGESRPEARQPESRV